LDHVEVTRYAGVMTVEVWDTQVIVAEKTMIAITGAVCGTGVVLVTQVIRANTILIAVHSLVDVAYALTGGHMTCAVTMVTARTSGV
jgi:hypothetical protein